MDRHDRFRPRRDRPRDFRRVYVERLGIDVDQDRPRADADDTAAGREERIGRRDDLVARTDPEGHQREQDRVGARRHSDGVRHAEHPGQLALERLDLRPHDEPLAVAHARDGGEDLVAERSVLRLQIEQRDVHCGCCPLHSTGGS